MKLNTKTIVGALLLWSFVAAQPAFSQSKQAAVSSDGAGLEVASAEALESAEPGQGQGSNGNLAGPSTGSNDATAEALAAEGVDAFEFESRGDFRRMAKLPVPGDGEGAGAEVILGPDTRERTYTRTYPARAKVLVTFSGGRCSGVMISKDTVATAGHCVHSGGRTGSWKTKVRVYPGRDGTVSPYGSCTAKRLYSVRGWTRNRDERYDYGAIKLNCTVGNTVGWYGITTANPKNKPSIIQGYPGDKPLEQWFSADKVRATTSRQVFYNNDTIGGMSGSPVWYDRSGPYVIGIHAYGTHGSGVHATRKHGTRIVRAVFNNLVNWKPSVPTSLRHFAP